MKGSRLTTKTERDGLARTFSKRMGNWSRKTLGGPCPIPGGKAGRARGVGNKKLLGLP